MAEDLPFTPMSELMASVDFTRRGLAHEMRRGTAQWGNWRYVPDGDAGRLDYTTTDGRLIYQIDLATCTAPVRLLEWLIQLEGKTWMTAENLGDLVRGLLTVLPMGLLMSHPDEPQDIARHIQTFTTG